MERLIPAPRKILAIKLRAMGDTILMTAPLAELRRAYPEAQIDVLVPHSWSSLLEQHPAVNQVLAFERRKEAASRAKAIVRTALMLRKQKYDWVVNFHASPSSSMLAFASGAQVRSVHFHGHKDKNKYSTVTIPGKGTVKPIIERDMDAVRALGIHAPAGRAPKIYLSAGEKARGTEFSRGLGSDPKSPVLALGLGASRPTKAWPVQRYATLAVLWAKELEGGAIAFFGKGEEHLCTEFLKGIEEDLMATIPDSQVRAKIRSRIVVQTGLPLRSVASILSQCSVFVGNDSGPKHLAVSLGVASVTLFGPEDPFEWHPYPQDRHPYFYQEGLTCRNDAAPGMPPWCGLNLCVEEQHRCMRGFGVIEVFEKCRSLLANEIQNQKREPVA